MHEEYEDTVKKIKYLGILSQAGRRYNYNARKIFKQRCYPAPREGDGLGFRTEISDTGSGIGEEDLPFIFERFFRADRSRSRSTGGYGIGLTIVRELVEA